MRAGDTRHQLAGVIASSGFASGDRVVVGHWWRSPIGPFTDLMWAEPDGVRVLVVPDERAARFVRAVYRFDRVEIEPFEVWSSPRVLVVRAGGRQIELEAARGIPLPPIGWPPFVRWVEGPVARLLMGVRTYGVSPTGVHEWYRARRWRPLRAARASVDGVDLGPAGSVTPPVRVGFSEPPRRPSMVRVDPLLWDPSGRLDHLLAREQRLGAPVSAGGLPTARRRAVRAVRRRSPRG